MADKYGGSSGGATAAGRYAADDKLSSGGAKYGNKDSYGSTTEAGASRTAGDASVDWTLEYWDG